jgi:hypothetical protein
VNEPVTPAIADHLAAATARIDALRRAPLDGYEHNIVEAVANLAEVLRTVVADIYGDTPNLITERRSALTADLDQYQADRGAPYKPNRPRADRNRPQPATT